MQGAAAALAAVPVLCLFALPSCLGEKKTFASQPPFLVAQLNRVVLKDRVALRDTLPLTSND